MELTVKCIGGWHYVMLAGRQDAFGYSTEEAAYRRLEAILDGWI